LAESDHDFILAQHVLESKQTDLEGEHQEIGERAAKDE
jgi:hypothetical protein